MHASQHGNTCQQSSRTRDPGATTGDLAACPCCGPREAAETTRLTGTDRGEHGLKELRGPIYSVQPKNRDFHYQIDYRLGGGGSGVVYRARRSSDDLPVALKLPAQINDPVGAASVAQEIDALSRLEHPNIVRLLDWGETDGGDPYLAVEFLEGETLDRLLARTGPLSVGRAAQICLKLAQALEHAHKVGFVHCDLKPSNIVVTLGDHGDRVSVIDFGIAEKQTDNASTAKKCRSATLLYMSPEQSLMRELTGSSDVYQLGLILFEMLFGELPFPASAKSAIQYRVSGDLVPAVCSRDGSCVVPMGMKACVLKALARNLQDRHASIQEFIQDIQPFALVPTSTSDD